MFRSLCVGGLSLGFQYLCRRYLRHPFVSFTRLVAILTDLLAFVWLFIELDETRSRHRGLRGPVGSFMFMNLRLLNDQSLENVTGVGAPPWTWPIDEQVIDLFHKGVYAFVTGAVADRLIPDATHARARGAHDPGAHSGRLV